MKGHRAEILSKIKGYIREVDASAEVILFGSQARMDQREDSDWDILILTPSPSDLNREQVFRHKLFELELEFGIALSTMVYSKSDWEVKHQVTPLYQNIKREGIRI